MAKDHYTVLGLKTDASAATVERAYREQVRKHHPDLNPDDENARAKFQTIQTAFDVLHDPEQREKYDLSRGTRKPCGRAEPSSSVPLTATILDDAEIDALRFFHREPGTAMIPYRRHGRLGSLMDWLAESDFLLPLFLILPLVLIHAVSVLSRVLAAIFR